MRILIGIITLINNDIIYRMKQALGKILLFPWYPLIFCLFPVLALLSANLSQVYVEVVWRPLLTSLVGTGVGYLILFLLFRDVNRAAFALILLLLMFFSYGQIYNLAKEWLIFGYKLGRNILMLPIWGILSLLVIWWATRLKLAFRKYTLQANIFSLVMLVYPLFIIFTSPEVVKMPSSKESQPSQVENTDAQQPDIYYIIADSYGREDLLNEVYGYNNHDFIESLRKMGFYIAQCSQSNFARTELSLASSLNMDYLQNLNPYFIPAHNADHSPLWDLIHNSTVRTYLTQHGYQMVAFATGFPWTEITGANVYYSPRPSGLTLNEFEGMLIQTTMLRILQDASLLSTNQATAENYRQRTLLVFEKISDIVQMPAPTFTFIHLIPPHPPFVFDASGGFVNQEEYPSTAGHYSEKDYISGYLDQVTFINAHLEEMARYIIENSPIPPIIIIQGDHGPWNLPKNETLKILNAYYLPGHEDKLYPTITPVNTFRIVLNEYLNAKYDLLTDISYYSPYDRYYEFSIIPNTCVVP